MPLDLNEIREFTLQTAKAAGTLIRDMRTHGEIQHRYKDKQELVTSADLAADKLIVEQIKKRYPTHRVLSEEGYNDKSIASDLASPIWIIDPIDGTVNYAHGQLMVAVSIAFACDGEVQVGVVHNPFMDETFVATLNQPSTLNGLPIKVSGLEVLRKGLIATGFPYDKSGVPPIVNRVEKVLMECQDLRRLGSAALDICWVACGRLDGYFESLSPWDFAAARLIALQAGAKCGHFSPVPAHIPDCIHCNDLLISTPAIYDKLHSTLQP
jgi:myo-inositol-1(or 4)-monophosphatase